LLKFFNTKKYNIINNEIEKSYNFIAFKPKKITVANGYVSYGKASKTH